MGMFEARAGDIGGLSTHDFEFVCVPSGAVDFAALANPNLNELDVVELRAQPNAQCVVALHEGVVAGSLWALRGQATSTELGEPLDLGDRGHYLCRAHVRESFRGRALHQLMIAYYAELQGPDDRICGLIYDWNKAAIRGALASGRQRTATHWATWVLGHRIAGVRRVTHGARRDGLAQEECLILAGENAGSALHAARQLGKRGVDVYVAAPKGWGRILRASRYCRAVHEFAPNDAETYCREVEEWAQGTVRGKHAVPVIPLSDRLVDHVNQHRSVFAPMFRLAVPSPEAVDKLVSKRTSLATAERAGLDVPAWCVVSERDEIADADRLHLPVIVKPTSWSTGGAHPFKLRVIRDAGHLDRLLEETVMEGATVLVQEYLPAADGSVEFGLTWRSLSGDQTVVCTGRKKRQAAADGGIMAWGVAEDDPGVRELAERFLDESDFVGLGGIEFIRDESKDWFIEFNPRPEAIHFLSEAAGQPMVWWLYQDLKGRSVEVAPQLPAGAWVGPAWLERMRRDPHDVPLWWRDRMAFTLVPRKAFSVWDPWDPVPAVIFVHRLVRTAARSVMRRRGPHVEGTT